MQKSTTLRKKLNSLKVDGILISDLVNVRYLTGFTGTSGFVIITRDKPVFVTDFRYEEQAKTEVKGFSIIIERSERTGEIRDICKEHGIKKLGFEDHNITYAYYKKLEKKKIKLKPLSNTVEDLRVVKTAHELSCITTAVRRAEAAFRKLEPHIRTGVSEQKLALKLEDLLKKEGCKMLPFGVIVASGPMSALPHARPSGRTLKKGDLVVIDWGGECEGYFSDMTRTVLLKGKNIHRQKELYYNVREAQEKALRSVKTGIKASAVDDAARSCIEEKGYGDYFGHGTGHGVGLEVHEKPSLSWRSRDIIRKNMVFTVEPGIYLPGMGGARIEDMVAAASGKPEVMTSLPGELRIIKR